MRRVAPFAILVFVDSAKPMPIYEYQCAKGHVTEHVAPISQSDEPIVCPQCSSEHKRPFTKKRPLAHRIVSLTGAPKFKAGGAGGFYKPNS